MLDRIGVYSGADPYFYVRGIGSPQRPGRRVGVRGGFDKPGGGRSGGVRSGLHVCRGNWSQKEETLLSGSYHPLAPYLARLNVQQLVLEYATPRAGQLDQLLSFPQIRAGKELGLGVVNPRIETVETVEQIVARVKEALNFLPPEHIFLNPDCGFGTFSTRPMNTVELAASKLEAMVQAATILRRELA